MGEKSLIAFDNLSAMYSCECVTPETGLLPPSAPPRQ